MFSLAVHSPERSLLAPGILDAADRAINTYFDKGEPHRFTVLNNVILIGSPYLRMAVRWINQDYTYVEGSERQVVYNLVQQQVEFGLLTEQPTGAFLQLLAESDKEPLVFSRGDLFFPTREIISEDWLTDVEGKTQWDNFNWAERWNAAMTALRKNKERTEITGGTLAYFRFKEGE